MLESADGRTPISPEFMSRILQGLSYRHGAAGRDGDVGERREISVAVFDGEAYSQTRTMEVRLVDKTPNPAGYVNTFIGTAEQKRMGVAGLEGNIAGMTFPGRRIPSAWSSSARTPGADSVHLRETEVIGEMWAKPAWGSDCNIYPVRVVRLQEWENSRVGVYWSR